MTNSDPSRRRLLALALLLALFVVGCGYGPVSPAAFQHAKALYTVANLQASDGLPALEAKITNDLESGSLSEREADWLRAIAEDCSAARWDVAQTAARQMMEDQAAR